MCAVQVATKEWIQQTQKRFFDRLFVKLGYKTMDDWYNVTQEEICKNGGKGVLPHFKGSPSLALQSVYPEHNWMLWRSKMVPKGYLSRLQHDMKETIRLIEWLGEQLSIKSLNDWYRAPLLNVKNHWIEAGSRESLGNMLQKVYPQHQWNMNLFGHHTKSSQGILFRVTQQLFPNHKVEEDYKHPKLMHSSGHNMELDVYIEDLKLASEYQGEQHFRPSYWTSSDFAEQQNRDKEKREACRQHGVTLIEIPYWWNKLADTLKATIHKVRSDLVSNPPGVEPIPESSPHSHWNGLKWPALCHGYSWNGSQDVTGWWMSEKMDGVRAYWDGKKLLTRHGNMISSPEWFIPGLPTNITLDGELWMGTGTTHEHLMKVLNSQSADWSGIGYYIFDIPSSNGTYEDRMKEMESIVSILPSHVHVVENVECKGTEHLHEYLNSIVAAQGEGVMLRKRHTYYEMGYTSSLLKVKKYEDTEVKVLGVVEGGLSCQQYNGLECVVKDVVLDNPLPSNSTIVVKHQGVSSTGLLKNPVYWRQLALHENLVEAPDWRDFSSHKHFFNKLAKARNISQPKDRYEVKVEDVYKQGGQTLLQQYYGNSLYKALVHSFPDIEILPWMFEEKISDGFWKDIRNQRYNWYNVTGEDIHNNGGGGLLSNCYNNSPSRALHNVYPEHQWDFERFKYKPRRSWEHVEDQKMFFDSMYIHLGFQ